MSHDQRSRKFYNTLIVYSMHDLMHVIWVNKSTTVRITIHTLPLKGMSTTRRDDHLHVIGHLGGRFSTFRCWLREGNTITRH